MHLIFLLVVVVFASNCDDEKNAAPCICEFSRKCLSDVDELPLVEVKPKKDTLICNPGPPLTILHGHPAFTLNAGQESCLDRSYWDIYSTPYFPDSPPFSLEGKYTDREISIDSSNLKSGNYSFILWCSDRIDNSVLVWNVTIREREIIPKIILPGNGKNVSFEFYAGNEEGHECFAFPPAPYIEFYGSYPFPLDYPSPNLTYHWRQTSGMSLDYDCDELGFFTTRAFFDTDKPVAKFVPGSVGNYCFELIIGMNGTNSTPVTDCIDVIPVFSETKKKQNIGPFCGKFVKMHRLHTVQRNFSFDLTHCHDPDQGPNSELIFWYKPIDGLLSYEGRLDMNANTEIDFIDSGNGWYASYWIWVSDGDEEIVFAYVAFISPTEKDVAGRNSQFLLGPEEV